MSGARTVYKCDKLSMEVLEVYPSAREAERIHGLTTDSVAQRCKLRRIGHEPYVWRYADDYDPEESFEGKRNRPIAAFDAKTGKAYVFPNRNEAAKALNVDASGIGNSMENAYLLCRRYAFKYVR